MVIIWFSLFGFQLSKPIILGQLNIYDIIINIRHIMYERIITIIWNPNFITATKMYWDNGSTCIANLLYHLCCSLLVIILKLPANYHYFDFYDFLTQTNHTPSCNTWFDWFIVWHVSHGLPFAEKKHDSLSLIDTIKLWRKLQEMK